MKYIAALLFLSFSYSHQGDSDINFKTGLESDGIPGQIAMVARLSGRLPIKGDTKINDRFSVKNRSIVRNYLLQVLQPFCNSVYVDAYSVSGQNVVGVIKSTILSDEYIVIGAHYDTVKDCPGANDNATGVAMIYSVAKYLSFLQERKYNIMVVFFDEEEKGLIGSRAFAHKLKKEAVNVHSVHTVDQMGWDNEMLENDEVGDRAIELEKPSDEMLAIYKSVKHDFITHVSTVDATDHKAFRELGFEAIGLTEEYVNNDTTPHYHKPSDTFSTINFEYLKSSTKYFQTVMKILVE